MKALERILDAMSRDPLANLIEREDGWYTAEGYPVTKSGRPDWCAKCAALETSIAKHDPHFRPARAVHETSKRGDDVALPLCQEHVDSERRRREDAAAKKAGRAA